jgi:hypothetical protein
MGNPLPAHPDWYLLFPDVEIEGGQSLTQAEHAMAVIRAWWPHYQMEMRTFDGPQALTLAALMLLLIYILFRKERRQ